MILVFAEKTAARNLQPGELFTFDLDQNTEWWGIELSKSDVAIPIFIRTNVDAEDLPDKDTMVLRLTIEHVNEGGPSKGTMDPHAPPGVER